MLAATGHFGTEYYQALQAANFTGNGYVDLFYSRYSDDHYYLIKGTADGFETVSQEATIECNSRAASGNSAGGDRPIDIDGDGDLDLLIGHDNVRTYLDNGVRVLINDGTGFFADTAYFAVVDPVGQPNSDAQSNFGYPAGILAGDYNDDGVVDLLTFESGSGPSGTPDGFDSVSVFIITLDLEPVNITPPEREFVHSS